MSNFENSYKTLENLAHIDTASIDTLELFLEEYCPLRRIPNSKPGGPINPSYTVTCITSQIIAVSGAAEFRDVTTGNC